MKHLWSSSSIHQIYGVWYITWFNDIINSGYDYQHILTHKYVQVTIYQTTINKVLPMGELLNQSKYICSPGGWFNTKIPSYQYRKFHCGDKKVVRPSPLHNGISYIGKTTSLYWIRAQEVIQWQVGEVTLLPKNYVNSIIADALLLLPGTPFTNMD